MLHLHRKKALRIKAGSFLLFGLICLVQSATAQEREINLYDHDTKPYYFGITLGGALSRFQVEPHSRFLQDDSVFVVEPKNSGGFTLGLLATARLSDRFQLRFNPQLFFTARSIYYKLKFP